MHNSKALHNGGGETNIIVCGFYVILSWLESGVSKVRHFAKPPPLGRIL